MYYNNIPFSTKKDFYKVLDSLEISDKSRTYSILIMNLVLDNFGYLPVSIKKEGTGIRIEFFDNENDLNSILYFDNGIFRHNGTNIYIEDIQNYFKGTF